MKYSGSLVKEEREKIFQLFLDSIKLKFSEIEKKIKIRSNMVSYHLERMQKEGIVEKKGDYYYLTKDSEKYLPFFSNLVGQELSPLPIILVAAMRKEKNQEKILMIKRNRRPYKDYLSLIGGKMLLEEDFEQASLRQVKQKTNLDTKFSSMNAVLQERVEGDDMVKHNFILFFTKVTTTHDKFRNSEYGKLKWYTLKELEKQKVIPSDRWLIENKLKSKISVRTSIMNEKDGELTSFDIQN